MDALLNKKNKIAFKESPGHPDLNENILIDLMVNLTFTIEQFVFACHMNDSGKTRSHIVLNFFRDRLGKRFMFLGNHWDELPER